MKKYWSRKASTLLPYTAGEQPKIKNLIKLNTNENAYPPSSGTLRAIREAAGADLRKYPPLAMDALTGAAAKAGGLAPENIFCSNGSDEALALCFLAFFDPGRPVLTMDVTYSFYPVWAKLFDITLKEVPLNGDFTVPLEKMAGAEGGVVLANPNAPTGIALSAGEVEEIVRQNDCVVIVDEAYFGFGAQSVLPLVKKYGNLAVVRTLSKSHSLAGLRVGYVAASPDLIAALASVRDSFNSYPIDSLAQAGGAAALADGAYYKANNEKIIKTREYTANALLQMGVAVLPSEANFIFIKPPVAAETVFNKLREKGIVVRWFNKERISGYLRVSIGTMEEMECFIGEMKRILNG